MANAYKCDRCGALYEKYMTPRREYNVVKDNHPYGDTYLDFCDECYARLMKFLGKENELDKSSRISTETKEEK